MDKQQLIQRIQAIGSCESDSDRLELLAQLQDETTADYDRLSQLEEENRQVTSDNEDLRSANMKLFKRLGEQKEPEDPIKNDDGKQKRKFNDLFNEKGELK